MSDGLGMCMCCRQEGGGKLVEAGRKGGGGKLVEAGRKGGGVSWWRQAGGGGVSWWRQV